MTSEVIGKTANGQDIVLTKWKDPESEAKGIKRVVYITLRSIRIAK